ncbi:hypothetical protein GCM10010170_089850 [Dactylosporangium salmoneum]|uniref:Uncharacterized protein n=1 Tax=Dactylosporangium salmoneum TaxID=53361 RepID=A0ABN3HJ97_9ACTN
MRREVVHTAAPARALSGRLGEATVAPVVAAWAPTGGTRAAMTTAMIEIVLRMVLPRGETSRALGPGGPRTPPTLGAGGVRIVLIQR